MMKYVMLVAVMLIVANVAAAPSDCEFIKESDQRNYCRAITKHQQSWCEFIKNNDLRHQCRAMSSNKK